MQSPLCCGRMRWEVVRSKEHIPIGAKAPLVFRFAPLSPREQGSEAMRDLYGVRMEREKIRTRKGIREKAATGNYEL